MVAGSLVAPGAFAGVTTLAANTFAAATTVGSMAFAALPAAITTGGVTGGVIGGLVNLSNDKPFWEGALGGAVSGTIFSLGSMVSDSLMPISPSLSLMVRNSTISNTIDSIYYSFISDGESSITESDLSADPSYYVNNGNPSKAEILDYIKGYMANNSDGHSEKWFTPKAWFYYNEYKAHMYAWNMLSDYYTGNPNDGFLPKLAYSAHHVDLGENKWHVTALTILLGLLGI